ncbi:hypothetical protein AQZ52_09075 [Novosphingobium fuchskuhlense]|uniref:TonB C-terminal domain-containing protein n=1 Tax=Novosphingobium fuchskuhlense TaxID=1117702 RepID=A0A117UVR8_9SPHN|nr:hypothetical protein [Novosphingobium fuchskuhlense]KUR71738.1 hypothetical protein AQZ52_09075 [Novosphingobium fuchskuhlense]
MARRILAATALLALPWASASAQTSPVPNPPPLPWGLDGAGKITVADEGPLLPSFGFALERYAPKVDLIIADAGRIDQCGAADQLVPGAVVEQLCEVLKRAGRVEFPAGVELPANGRLRIQASARPLYTPKQPIRVVANASDKHAVQAEIREGPDGSCGLLSRNLADGFEDAICKAWIAKGRPGRPNPAGTGGSAIGVVVDDQAPPVFTRSFEWVFSEGGPTASSLGDPEARVTLAAADGRLVITMTDYPSRALRARMEARVKVWIGFDRTGKALSCRPVESSNGAYLANVTCLAMLRRARFEFAADAASFSGIRYVSKAVRWAVPE